MLSLLGELIGLRDRGEFCSALLAALIKEIPSEWTALNELPADLPDAISITNPPTTPEQHASFARYGHQNPIAAHFQRTGDGRATRFSDVTTRRELHRLELYREVYADPAVNVEFQIAFLLPSRAEHILGVVLSRSHRDFTAHERDLLNLARPYLIELYRSTLTTAGPGAALQVSALMALGLTRRQAQVLELTARGHPAGEVAASLGISSRTAEKHLERCYRVLGVSNRAAALTAAHAALAALAARTETTTR